MLFHSKISELQQIFNQPTDVLQKHLDYLFYLADVDDMGKTDFLADIHDRALAGRSQSETIRIVAHIIEEMETTAGNKKRCNQIFYQYKSAMHVEHQIWRLDRHLYLTPKRASEILDNLTKLRD